MPWVEETHGSFEWLKVCHLSLGPGSRTSDTYPPPKLLFSLRVTTSAGLRDPPWSSWYAECAWSGICLFYFLALAKSISEMWERERMGNWRTHSRWPCLMWLRSSRNETFLDSEIAVCPQRVEGMVSEAWNPGPSISSNYLSFLSLSPPREEGGMLFTTEFSLKGFLFSCAPSLRYWNYFLLFNPPPVEKLCEIRGVGFQVYSFRWCCIFTPNHRVCLSFCSFCFM